MSVMEEAKVFVNQTWTYRGGVGQLSWVLHRVTGLGIFTFLLLHIFDIFLVGFDPVIFDTLAVIYHHPVMRIGHIFLFFCVLFHAVNGMRVIILDFFPVLWQQQKQSATIAGVIIGLIFVISTGLILYDTLFGSHGILAH